MKPTLTLLGASAILFGGVDASTLREEPIQRVEHIAGYEIKAEQKGNKVETVFPWKDQKGLTVSFDMGEPTTEEKIKDKRKKEVITEVVDFGEGGFKIDILLDEKPDTNRFCYEIQGAENYDFFHQPPLTEQEKAEGASRPPEIEGSYAVYHKTLKNHQIGKENYATGKVMHIPRPQVWEVNDKGNTTVWADLLYENGQLCVTASQSFLDSAKYPVRIDPTFGYTTAGVSILNVAGAACLGRVGAMNNPLVASTGDTVTSISIYAFASSTSYFDVAIYQSTGVPTNLLGKASTTVGTSLAWATSSELSFLMTQGNTYVQAFSVNNPLAFGHSIGWDAGEVPGRVALNPSGTCESDVPMADPFGTVGTDSGRRYSIYASYRSPLRISTTPASNITASTASFNGEITSTGSTTVTQHGFVWGTGSSLVDGDTTTTTLGTGATGTISETITSLRHETTYYFRAYATNSSGNAFGSILSFTTIANPRTRINNGTIKINNGTLDL